MTVQEYLNKTRKIMWSRTRPYIHCPDGFEISVQASAIHYCIPRRDNAEFYKKVELGYPNLKDDLIIEYAETPDKPTETVYGFVPIELVETLIQKHGGIVNVPDFDMED